MPRDSFRPSPGGQSSYTTFAKLALVRKLPYKVLTTAEQMVLKEYFDVAPFFENNKWTIYVEMEDDKPVLLLPIKEVWDFFDSIERETGISLPKHPKSKYCQRKNPAGNDPKLVAVIESKAEYDAISELHGGGGGSYSNMTPEEKAAAKERRAADTKQRNRLAWGSQIVKARKLLGFDIEHNENSSTGASLRTLFVCVDVESWEQSHNLITEIGIASLDTADTPSTHDKPTTYSVLKQHIKYRHLRVLDHMHLRNGRFVPDNSERFDFGQSERVMLEQLPAAIAECFRPRPLGGVTSKENGDGPEDSENRQIVFIGHDAKADLKYLQQAGYNAHNIRNLIVYDTALMYKVLTGDSNSVSLSKMAKALGLEPWHLHNAGNDAAFTIQSFLKIAEKGLAPESEDKEEALSESESLVQPLSSTTLSDITTSEATSIIADSAENNQAAAESTECRAFEKQEAIERFIMGSGSSDEYSEDEKEEKKLEKKRSRQQREYLNTKRQRNAY